MKFDIFCRLQLKSKHKQTIKVCIERMIKKNFSQICCEFLGTESLISWSIKYLILSINLMYEKQKTAVVAFWLILRINGKMISTILRTSRFKHVISTYRNMLYQYYIGIHSNKLFSLTTTIATKSLKLILGSMKNFVTYIFIKSNKFLLSFFHSFI